MNIEKRYIVLVLLLSSIYGCCEPEANIEWKVVKTPRAYGGPLTILYKEETVFREHKEWVSKEEQNKLTPISGLEEGCNPTIGIGNIYHNSQIEIGAKLLTNWLPIGLDVEHRDVQKIIIKFGKTYVTGYSQGSILDYIDKRIQTDQKLRDELTTEEHKVVSCAIVAEYLDFIFLSAKDTKIDLELVLKDINLSLYANIKKVDAYTLRLNQPSYIAYQSMIFKQ